MRVLVVGLGSAGARHLNNLFALGVKDLLVFRSQNLPPPGNVSGKNFQVFHNYDEALALRPDAVVIANPTSYHINFSKKALEAGCHIYIEKPVSHTLDGTDELMALADKQKKVVMVGCQLRFHPNLMEIKEWAQKGFIGQIYSVYSDVGEYLPDWHPWEDYRHGYAARAELGGGVILTLIHELDYLFWIFGPIGSVYAMGGHLTPLEIDVEDTVLISLKTKQGVPVQVRMDYWRNPPSRKMHIVGEKGEIYWDYYKGEVSLSRKGSIVKQNSLPENWNRNELFISIMKNFLDSIEGNTIPGIPLSEGVEVLKIALAAKSAMIQKKVICL